MTGSTLPISDAHVVRGYRLDTAGRAADERIPAWSIDGVPEGLKVDAAGNLFGAAPGA